MGGFMANEIYIGDNLKVMQDASFLKKHQETIKMIYIDPPYNTHDLKCFNDRVSSEEWADFMQLRLMASKKLLKNDGIIFISIDDNEYANLKLICDNVFGKENFVGTFITLQSQRSNSRLINTVHEYILCYSKNKSKLHRFVIKRTQIPEDKKIIEKLTNEVNNIISEKGIEAANKELKKIVIDYCDRYNITWLKNYSNVDENGRIYFAVDLSTPGKPRSVNIESIGLRLDPLPTRGWSSDEKFIQLHNQNRLCFRNNRPYAKHYLSESENNAPSLIRFFSRQGTEDLKRLGLTNLFDTPKPVEMLKFLIRISIKNDDKVLDFFAGSGSLGQAVYEVNKEDNKNIEYVLVQAPEKINPKNKVFDACKKFGITPTVDNILKFRLEKYLALNNRSIDFQCFEID